MRPDWLVSERSTPDAVKIGLRGVVSGRLTHRLGLRRALHVAEVEGR